MRGTHSGNRPLTRATYSFLTVFVVNSSVKSLARCAEVGMIINPEVSRSSLFAAEGKLVDGVVCRKVM